MRDRPSGSEVGAAFGDRGVVCLGPGLVVLGSVGEGEEQGIGRFAIRHTCMVAKGTADVLLAFGRMDGGHQLLVVLDDEHYELLVHRAEGLGVEPEGLAAKLIAEALDGSIA